MSRLHHTLNVLLYPAVDLPGQWISHCLEIDVISQGNSQEHAFEMMAEAIEIIAKDNVEHGGSPLFFRSAPKEDWDRLRDASPLNVARIVRLDVNGSFPDDVTLEPQLVRSAS